MIDTTSIRCYYCGGRTDPALVADLYAEHGTYVVVENVPADVCQQCGERYYSPQVTDRLLALTAEARKCPPTGRRTHVLIYDLLTLGACRLARRPHLGEQFG